MEIRVRIRVRLTVALFSHFSLRTTKTSILSSANGSPAAKRYLVYFGLRKAAGESNFMCIFKEKIP